MNATRNYPLIFIRSVTWILMLMAAFISASHIVHVSQTLGLHGWYAYTTPGFIDVIAIAGKLSMLSRFDAYPAFQRSGRWMLIAGGTLSLAANIGAGANWGERGYGVLIVGGFLLLENHLTKAAGKVKESPAAELVVDPAAAERRKAGAVKAVETKARRKAEREAAAAAAAAKVEQRKADRRAAAAVKRAMPVSPAPAPGAVSGLHIATPGELAKLTGIAA